MGNILSQEHLAKAKKEKSRHISIPSLEVFPELLQGFTTRYGGVSAGDYAELNLNFNRPDPRSNVLENYKLLADDLGVALNDMVLSYQVHGKRVLPVNLGHAGMGLIKERSFSDADGLMTNTPGLMLVTLYADCVPLYFYDPVKRVIALTHSGWRGTLLNIGSETVGALAENYGCRPADLFVSFGPHIAFDCFEVDEDVAGMFFDRFGWAKMYAQQKPGGKWHLDLQRIISKCLVEQGVVEEKITGSKVCTRCERDLFFSHRGSLGKSGTGAAFMMIRGSHED